MSTSKRVRLRAPEVSDFEKFAEWVNNVEVWENLGEGPIFDSRYLATRIDEENQYVKWLKDPTQRFFSVETVDGALIGHCLLMHIDWTNRHAELGIVIGDPAYWNQGYGTETIDLVLDLAFDGYNLHRVQLCVNEKNARGQRCYEKCGFRTEGVLRQFDFVHGGYSDVVLMSILEAEYRAEKAERLFTRELAT